jgi:hypothetical protein
MSRRMICAVVTGCAAGVLIAVGGAGGAQGTFRLRVSAQKLPALKGARYEVWVIDGKRKLSAGTFNPRSTRYSRSFASRVDPAKADAIAVTIEPKPDPSPGPSPIVILLGKSGTHSAKLRFPVKLKRISGRFLLATPTDDDSANETAGVWFLRIAAGMKMRPSLVLPKLPAAGWVWEGWGVTQNTPLSSGRFTSARGADRSSRFSGPKAGPPFPGEDFLQNLPARVSEPVRLNDGSSMVVLTLEPNLRGTDPTGAAPFSIKPLVATVARGARDHTSISLRRDLKSVPSGTARF